MDDEFDPLSFLSAGPNKETEFEDEQLHTFQPSMESIATPTEETNNSNSDDEEIYPIHALDIPTMHQNPPYIVMHTILRLLEKPEIHNFHDSQAPTSTKTPTEILLDKNTSLEDAEITLKWLELNGSVLGRSLNQLVSSLTSLTKNKASQQDLIAYLTKIISTPLHPNSTISQEEHESLLDLSATIIAQSSGRASFPTFTRHIDIPNLNTGIKLVEPAMTYENLGLKTWASSLYLSTRLCQPGSLERLIYGDVLELGAGTGLVGITLGKLGVSNEVMLTDLPEIVKNMRTNIEANGLGDVGKIGCEVLDWTNPGSFLEIVGEGKQYGTVILSDPIYSELHPYWVRDMIGLFSDRAGDGRVLIQIPIRLSFEKERADLWRLIFELGMVEVESDREDGYDDFGEQKYLFKVFKWKK